eukprot:376213-Rhodomonas_salina.2
MLGLCFLRRWGQMEGKGMLSQKEAQEGKLRREVEEANRAADKGREEREKLQATVQELREALNAANETSANASAQVNTALFCCSSQCSR